MQLVDAWKRAVLERYATFSGRATRGEYWWFAFASLLIFVVLFTLSVATGAFAFMLIWILYSLAILVPNLALAFRRLHDTERTAWWLLIGLIPLGSVVLLIFFVLPGTPVANRYGPVPEGLPSA
ncbi:MAG: DUF805 domain-containing protein [Actinomycetota bacterium]